MMGLLGWEPDAPKRRARLAPQLPPQWESVAVRNLRVGETSIDAVLEQAAGHFAAEISGRGPEVDLEIAIPVPPGAYDLRPISMPVGATGELQEG